MKNTLFQRKYYEQLDWTAMGLPISIVVANLFKETFDVMTRNTATDCREDMLMIPLWFKSHATRTSSLNISTELVSTFNSMWKI